MQENCQKNFDHEVRKKSQLILEKREIDIQRKYRLQAQKDKTKFEKDFTEKHEAEIKDLKRELQAEIAEVSRIKSAEQVKTKKLNEQKKQLVEDLNQQKADLANQAKFSEYLNREKQVNMGLLQQKMENAMN